MKNRSQMEEDWKKVSEGKVSVDEIRQIAFTYMREYDELKSQFSDINGKFEGLKIAITGITNMVKVANEIIEG